MMMQNPHYSETSTYNEDEGIINKFDYIRSEWKEDKIINLNGKSMKGEIISLGDTKDGYWIEIGEGEDYYLIWFKRELFSSKGRLFNVPFMKIAKPNMKVIINNILVEDYEILKNEQMKKYLIIHLQSNDSNNTKWLFYNQGRYLLEYETNGEFNQGKKYILNQQELKFIQSIYYNKPSKEINFITQDTNKYLRQEGMFFEIIGYVIDTIRLEENNTPITKVVMVTGFNPSEVKNTINSISKTCWVGMNYLKKICQSVSFKIKGNNIKPMKDRWITIKNVRFNKYSSFITLDFGLIKRLEITDSEVINKIKTMIEDGFKSDDETGKFIAMQFICQKEIKDKVLKSFENNKRIQCIIQNNEIQKESSLDHKLIKEKSTEKEMEYLPSYVCNETIQKQFEEEEECYIFNCSEDDLVFNAIPGRYCDIDDDVFNLPEIQVDYKHISDPNNLQVSDNVDKEVDESITTSNNNDEIDENTEVQNQTNVLPNLVITRSKNNKTDQIDHEITRKHIVCSKEGNLPLLKRVI
ncbi:hypothetical protein KM1_005050 [Entamoeba histolytica HM-3:IMSS]|uniref:Uncharacterized protein n=5 Tax=Entamoeba TaxID=5758 RepID=B1N2M2_ENTH1|nr:hypothetical protein EHI_023160 [Entamoeba histolytica HM-1:IMSS]EDS89789.1 hypothetical protein EHI_023160 [Entamoeba histolytica HM-1:IMSS]EMS16639.1 hypothetical protein KM1_005050 [Entamoeba histolytica HM-3:IMSS]ENY62835.1 hypothetical protein EHI7A_060000 [Entamoeba histolytica HM-1:IMSS-A]GAT92327.1 hypothetical protein CL6EHI_023160 [Entamoeba histolytica]|eukprot:XP_001913438.1 hypothetical protein EHI_023160 [Entamoeba histolytica HM-1:IMSS]